MPFTVTTEIEDVDGNKTLTEHEDVVDVKHIPQNRSLTLWFADGSVESEAALSIVSITDDEPNND